MSASSTRQTIVLPLDEFECFHARLKVNTFGGRCSGRNVGVGTVSTYEFVVHPIQNLRHMLRLWQQRMEASLAEATELKLTEFEIKRRPRMHQCDCLAILLWFGAVHAHLSKSWLGIKYLIWHQTSNYPSNHLFLWHFSICHFEALLDVSVSSDTCCWSLSNHEKALGSFFLR